MEEIDPEFVEKILSVVPARVNDAQSGRYPQQVSSNLPAGKDPIENWVRIFFVVVKYH